MKKVLLYLFAFLLSMNVAFAKHPDNEMNVIV